MLRAAGQGRKTYVVRLGRHEGRPQQPSVSRVSHMASALSVLDRPDRLLACDAPFICTVGRLQHERTRSAVFVLRIAGQQPVPEGEIRAPLHAETTGDDRGE